MNPSLHPAANITWTDLFICAHVSTSVASRSYWKGSIVWTGKGEENKQGVLKHKLPQNNNLKDERVGKQQNHSMKN